MNNIVPFPRINIDLKKLKHNTLSLMEICKKYDIEITPVTKAVGALEGVVRLFDECGINMVADSRIVNLTKMAFLKQKKVLLRLPMISYVNEVVEFSDISLNSELLTVEALNEAAKNQNKMHEIILMIELGDLREGILLPDVHHFVREVLKMSNIHLAGVGTNLTCYGGVIPDEAKLKTLADIARDIESTFGIKLDIVSGGNSSTLKLLLDGKKIDSRINNLRIGEGLFIGREAAYGTHIEGLHGDVFTLEAEIIELKEKNSVPDGTRNMNAFGEKVEIKDVGVHTRAIIALGRQDVDYTSLTPFDKNIIALGASSDHTILDITHSKNKYKVGDIISFYIFYPALLGLMTSPYINKNYV